MIWECFRYKGVQKVKKGKTGEEGIQIKMSRRKMAKEDIRIPARSQAKASEEPQSSLFLNFLAPTPEEVRPVYIMFHQECHSEPEDTNHALNFLHESNLKQTHCKVRKKF